MNRRMRDWAIETIGFQNDPFPREFTHLLSLLREHIKNTPGIKKASLTTGYGMEIGKEMSDMVFSRFGIRTRFRFNVDSYGAIHVFPVNKNSALLKDYFRGNYADPSQDLLLKTINNKKGTIDNKNAKVSGIFSEYTHNVYINVYDYFRKDILTPAEVAAILLHEIGHAFTFYSMSDRLSTANRVLVDITTSIKAGEDASKRVYLYKELSDTYQIDEKEFSDLATESNRLVVGTKLFKKHVEFVSSQLPVDKYDETSSEQLADDFASKFGMGKELVVALDKITEWTPYKSITSNILAMMFSLLFDLIMFGIIMAASGLLFWGGFIIIGILFIFILRGYLELRGSAAKDMTYDDLIDRYQRVRNQLVASLNQGDLSKDEIKSIIDSVEAVDKCISSTYRMTDIVGQLSDWLFSSNREAVDEVKYQRLLEDLAHSDLYLMSAKFKTLN